MPVDHPAETALANPGPEMVSGTKMQSQSLSKERNLEHRQHQQKDASEQISTTRSQPSLPKFSKSDVELVLDNAELLSLYYDPITDEYQHELRVQSDKDRDFDIVHSLLNDPGCLKEEDSFVPRLDVFFIDCTREGDSLYPEERRGYEGLIPDAAMLQSRLEVARILHDALQVPLHTTSVYCVRLEKVFGHTIGSMLKGRTCSSYQVTSINCNIAWSHYAKTRQTVAIVTYRHRIHQLYYLQLRNRLIEYLTEHRSWAAYSMLLVLAAQTAFEIIREDNLVSYSDRTRCLERRTGYTLLIDSSGTVTADKEFDPAIETAEASGLAGLLAINHTYWDELQALADFALRETQRMLEDLKETSPPRLRSDLIYITELFEHSSLKYAARRTEAASLQSRASIQIQGLFNIIAQREQVLSRQLTKASLQLGEATRQIAEDSKRDSTSMKAIAAVTMLFLPGTFVASLFAMPIFSWNATAGNDVISHRIWVYWAVTIPLTLITFGCFLLWDHLMNKPRYPSMESLQAWVVSHQSLIPSGISPDPPKSSSTPEKK
jgi:hypothetical protein